MGFKDIFSGSIRHPLAATESSARDRVQGREKHFDKLVEKKTKKENVATWKSTIANCAKCKKVGRGKKGGTCKSHIATAKLIVKYS